MRSLQHSPDPSTAFFLYLDMLHRLSDQLAMPKFNSCLTPIYKTYVYHGVLTMWAPNSGFICHLGLTTPCSSNYTSPHTYTRTDTHTHTHTHTHTNTHTHICLFMKRSKLQGYWRKHRYYFIYNKYFSN